jgi:hypothetical protein
MLRPKTVPNDAVGLLHVLAAGQYQPSPDEGRRQAQHEGHDPKDLDTSGDGVHRLLQAHPALLGRSTLGA